jgi:hypothetical protein
MMGTTVVRETTDQGDAQAPEHDRTTSLRLGQLFVLAAGVVLVLVVVGMLSELVGDMLQDAAPGVAGGSSG